MKSFDKVVKKEKLNVNLEKAINKVFEELTKQNLKSGNNEYLTIRTICAEITKKSENELTWENWDGEIPLLATLNNLVKKGILEGLKPSETKGFSCKIFRLSEHDFKRMVAKVSK